MKDPYLLAGAVLIFGCIAAKRSPVSLIQMGCIYARAMWLLTATMAEGAWSRRNRWDECLYEAWRRR